MQEKPLLLSSAKIGVPQMKPARKGWVLVLLAFSLVCVTVGVVDLLARISGGYALMPADTVSGAPVHVDAEELAADATEPVVLQPFTPTRLSIPSLGVSASVELSGLKPDGAMQAPKHFDTVAWYKDGPKPGMAGNTVIAGHLNNAIGLSGVFEKLNTLSLGDTFTILGEAGESATYVVRGMTVYETADAPAKDIFTTSGPSQAILITCDGAWDKGAKSYDKRLVIVGELVRS